MIRVYGVRDFRSYAEGLISENKGDELLFGGDMTELETIPLFNGFALDYVSKLIKKAKKVIKTAPHFEKEGAYVLNLYGNFVTISAKRADVARKYPLIEQLIFEENGTGRQIQELEIGIDNMAGRVSFETLRQYAADFQENYVTNAIHVERKKSKKTKIIPRNPKHLKERIHKLYRVGNFPYA